jgi:hypothetical protein
MHYNNQLVYTVINILKAPIPSPPYLGTCRGYRKLPNDYRTEVTHVRQHRSPHCLWLVGITKSQLLFVRNGTSGKCLNPGIQGNGPEKSVCVAGEGGELPKPSLSRPESPKEQQGRKCVLKVLPSHWRHDTSEFSG